jgi:hypothetical protein
VIQRPVDRESLAMTLSRSIVGNKLVLCTVLVAICPGVSLGAAEGRKGHGHLTVEYQYISVDGFEASTGKIEIGTTDTHTLFFELDYNLTDRLAVFVGLPLVRKRYKGNFPHAVAGLDPPNNTAPFIDDGEWHTEWQDWHLGVRYLAKDGPLTIEPFISLGVPSSDYPFFAHAAAGQNLDKLDVGADFTYVPPISDAFFRLGIAYVFVEETLGTNIDHWRISGDAGYFFQPRLAGRLFFLLKHGNGLVFPDDFPPPRTDERWYQHDRMVKHNYMNVGAALDWAINENYALSTSVMTMAWADQVHIMDYTINMALTWSF